MDDSVYLKIKSFRRIWWKLFALENYEMVQ